MADEDKNASSADANASDLEDSAASDMDQWGYEAANPALQLSHWLETAHER